MIAAGLAPETEHAATVLRIALAAAGVSLPSIRVDPPVRDCAERGPVRLVELGSVLPPVAAQLTAATRKGAAA